MNDFIYLMLARFVENTQFKKRFTSNMFYLFQNKKLLSVWRVVILKDV
jgi:predicted ester cyclase